MLVLAAIVAVLVTVAPSAAAAQPADAGAELYIAKGCLDQATCASATAG